MSTNEFANTNELVPGTLRGYRSWRLWGSALRSISSNIPWLSSELVAMCDSELAPVKYKTLFPRIGDVIAAGLLHSSPEVRSEYYKTVVDREAHTAPNADCSCGIYAYYSPGIIHGGISGVIEASGKILMGTKGFRAEKAKILALNIESYASDIEIESYGQVFFTIKTYNVPVYNNFMHMLRDFPPDLDTVRNLIGDINDEPQD